jgi:hypothetical protein
MTGQEIDESGNVVSPEVSKQFEDLKAKLGKALDDHDQDQVIQVQAQIQDFAEKHNIHLSAPVTVNPDVAPESDTTPTHPTGERDQFGIIKIREDGPGKQFETEFDKEYKTRHYKSGKPDEPSVEVTNKASKAIKNQEATYIFRITKFKDADDTDSVKILGGPHSKGNPEKGTCYDCQLNVKGGNGNTLELERPHPSMHPAHKQAKPLFKIGETTVGKWVGIKTVTYTINGGKDRHLEMQVAFPIADINKPEDITFRKYWSVDDTGQLEAGHIIEPIGSLTTLRIDGLPKDALDTKYCSVREIKEG